MSSYTGASGRPVNSGYVKIKDPLPRQHRQRLGQNNNDPNWNQADEIVKNTIINQAISGGNAEQWKDIKPAKNYQEIKRKAFIDQKRKNYI